ncbi:hypothetical protein Cni_G20296 [Canna indica]|uniref:Retrotransposon gag domain-containing protein n=1 Tax=Canna indica TaxID=4628 RepID=A0AAQ3QJD4_9LILI|nr:hypothetical protein Cni_G20296 [Canna indica]
MEKTALLWFASLPPKSIHSFTNLSHAFLNRFFISRVYYKTEDALHYIRQGEHEPLREYIRRFQATSAEIPNLNPRVKLYSIKYELKPRHFADQIALIKPKDMVEFQEKAASFIEWKSFVRPERLTGRTSRTLPRTKNPKRRTKKVKTATAVNRLTAKGLVCTSPEHPIRKIQSIQY